jgi:hypothetical protein
MSADFKQGANLLGGTLLCGQIATAVATPLTAVPAASAWKVATAIIHNASATAIASVAINVTPSGGSSTRISLLQNLLAGESIEVFELKGAFLEAGAVITITPSAAAAANYYITGAVSS